MANIAVRRNTSAIYWASTAFAALVLTATGAAKLLHAPEIMQSLAHLGYPAYFPNITGVWELLGVAAILMPGYARLKEWAYAGMVFLLTGASLSHLAAGDPAAKVLFPLVVLSAVVVSAATRPPRRTVIETVPGLRHAA